MAFLRAVFGEWTWVQPEWLQRIGGKRLLGILAALMVAIAAVVGIQKYLDALPKPPQVVAYAAAPNISRVVGEELVIDPLSIDFRVEADPRTPVDTVDSVARLDAIGKRIDDGIRISPAIDGEFQWRNETQITFMPAVDWPAGQEYSVEFDASIFAPDLEFESFDVSFTTPPLRADLQEIMFYQDPVDRQVRKVVAELSFSHAVDADALQDFLAFAMRPSGSTGVGEPVSYELTQENFGRTAYVHSRSIEIPPQENYMTMTLSDGMPAAVGPSRLAVELVESVRIPDISSYFRTRDVVALIANDEDDVPRQTVTLSFTDRVTTNALQEKTTAWLLPEQVTINGQHFNNKYWSSPREVTVEVLQQAEPLAVEVNAVEGDAAQLHSITIDVPENRFVYLKLESGLKSEGDYVMSVPYDTVVQAPGYPREVKIARSGAIVPLTGDHKLTFLSRGVPALRVEVARIMDSELNHLASQTGGDVQSAWFTNYQFNADNLSVRETRYIDLKEQHPQTAQYSSLDLSEFLPSGGYYLINVQGWNRRNNTVVGGSDRRLVLVTDLGLLVKANLDSSQNVFVHSIARGEPQAGARVRILGKNGVPIYERFTDAQGHARFPPLRDYEREKTPTVFVVNAGSDSVFMPFNRNDRRLQYSRFDVGGEYTWVDNDAEQLKAQLFTDRGIYRPGDTVNIGVIVKGESWNSLDRLPLELQIHDPRYQQVLQQAERLPDGGFFDVPFETEASSATGDYNATLYLIENNQQRRPLGQVNFKVEEFQPDRLKIRTQVVGQKTEGWLKPVDLRAEVRLQNLFGTAAQDRRVAGEMTLRPSNINFSGYPDYTFTDPLRESGVALQTVTAPLADAQTNADGVAVLPLPVAQYDKGMYDLSVRVEGFEASGGRSVRSRARVMMSPLDYVVGYKSTANLAWLDRDSVHNVEFVALDSNAEAVSLADLELRLYEERYVSTLVQRPNGTYAYQSIRKETEVSRENYNLPASGDSVAIATASSGNFAVVVAETNGRELARVRYSVAGARNLAGNLERNAELDVKVRSDTVDPGADVELEITAPYIGTGLITIERDRVYAWSWFRTDSETSVQRIAVPADLEGNAYINVSYIRDLDSPEVFVSPLSYAVVPVSIDSAARNIDVSLTVPDLVRPGESLSVGYSASKASRIVVYGVDEGILQVANYRLPRPLEYFLPKMALQVSTLQMVDLILPEFAAFLKTAAPGGGDAAGLAGENLNPFRRKAEAPVVFWSGVIDAGPAEQTLSFYIPDYFNGQVRVMAVAVSDAAVGQQQTTVVARAPVVLTPNLATAVAPGDEFDVTLGIANNLDEGSAIDIELSASEHLEIIGAAQQSVDIEPGSEDSITFRVTASSNFGNAELRFAATAGDERVERSATVSVRPATAYVATTVASSAATQTVSVPMTRQVHPQFRKQRFAVSNSPLILADGMLDYLEVFPHYCAEQIVSRVFPQLGLLGNGDADIDDDEIRSAFDTTINTLRTRQLPGGGFRFWPGSNEPAEFASIYIVHFLTDARELGLAVPPAMLNAGLDYLRQVAGVPVEGLMASRQRAYAIYVLTRNGTVTTNYLTNLHEMLERQPVDAWQQDIAAAYMAASYALLQQEQLASDLIEDYAFHGGDEMSSDFDTRLGRDSQYIYLLSRHFSDRVAGIEPQQLQQLIEPVMSNRFNTLSASYAILALRAYGDSVREAGSASYEVVGETGDNRDSLATGQRTLRVNLEDHFDRLLVQQSEAAPVFTLLSQTGFETPPPQTAVANGLELSREYLDDTGKSVTSASIGDELTVRLRVRSTGRQRSNVAVVDLLPGGFEVLRESIRNAGGWNPDYRDVREDRVVIYGSFGNRVTDIVYRVKVTAAGSFAIPSAFAGSMYDRSVEARTAPGRFTVE